MNFKKGITAFLLGTVFVFSSVGVSEAYVKKDGSCLQNQLHINGETD